MTMKTTLSKTFGYTSKESVHIIQTNEKELIAFHTNKCSKISGIDDYLGCYISNNVRVFTPTKINYSKDFVKINFTEENVSFVCSRCSEEKVAELFGDSYQEWIKNGYLFFQREN